MNLIFKKIQYIMVWFLKKNSMFFLLKNIIIIIIIIIIVLLNLSNLYFLFCIGKPWSHNLIHKNIPSTISQSMPGASGGMFIFC